MDKFDDIPIKELNKAEGYQQQQQSDIPNEEVYDESELSLITRLDNPVWKIRIKAYKEISELFYNQYSKDCQTKNFD